MQLLDRELTLRIFEHLGLRDKLVCVSQVCLLLWLLHPTAARAQM